MGEPAERSADVSRPPYSRVMPDLSNVTAPVEWVVTHSTAKEPIAVVRRLRLGPARELYFRAVTWHRDAGQRQLVGYWGSVEEAVQIVYGLYERSLPPQFLMTGGATARQPAPLTKPKPPPASVCPAESFPVSVGGPARPSDERRMPALASARRSTRPVEPARQLATAGR
jgi:hypothetical protein